MDISSIRLPDDDFLSYVENYISPLDDYIIVRTSDTSQRAYINRPFGQDDLCINNTGIGFSIIVSHSDYDDIQEWTVPSNQRFNCYSNIAGKGINPHFDTMNTLISTQACVLIACLIIFELVFGSVFSWRSRRRHRV